MPVALAGVDLFGHPQDEVADALAELPLPGGLRLRRGHPPGGHLAAVHLSARTAR
ncbi:hypothetical protein ACFYVL_15885 [Streptomyces sp. NPDC004111]|uniref:hypothetical protein n=1 Tax=Streptomyces sp. NPDC004111 TaxID=3364690 RepID=UPI003693D0D2